MYKTIILIIKGFIIGLAKIIPGVSGSLFALNLGLYERGIDAISNFFKNVKFNIIFLGTVGIGILLAVVLGSKIISYTLINYYFITMLLFIGLLLGSVPELIKNTSMKTKKEYIYCILTFLIMILICFFKTTDNYIYQNNIYNNIYVIIIGIVDAATMIIPGVSGTAVLMMMGCYEFFLSIFSNLYSINNLVINIKVIFLFIMGLSFGIIIITKLMNYLLTKKQKIIYPIIIGFSLSSICILVFEIFSRPINYIQILIGIPLLLLGFKISKIMV